MANANVNEKEEARVDCDDRDRVDDEEEDVPTRATLDETADAVVMHATTTAATPSSTATTSHAASSASPPPPPLTTSTPTSALTSSTSASTLSTYLRTALFGDSAETAPETHEVMDYDAVELAASSTDALTGIPFARHAHNHQSVLNLAAMRIGGLMNARSRPGTMRHSAHTILPPPPPPVPTPPPSHLSSLPHDALPTASSASSASPHAPTHSSPSSSSPLMHAHSMHNHHSLPPPHYPHPHPHHHHHSFHPSLSLSLPLSVPLTLDDADNGMHDVSGGGGDETIPRPLSPRRVLTHPSTSGATTTNAPATSAASPPHSARSPCTPRFSSAMGDHAVTTSTPSRAPSQLSSAAASPRRAVPSSCPPADVTTAALATLSLESSPSSPRSRMPFPPPPLRAASPRSFVPPLSHPTAAPASDSACDSAIADAQTSASASASASASFSASASTATAAGGGADASSASSLTRETTDDALDHIDGAFVTYPATPFEAPTHHHPDYATASATVSAATLAHDRYASARGATNSSRSTRESLFTHPSRPTWSPLTSAAASTTATTNVNSNTSPLSSPTTSAAASAASAAASAPRPSTVTQTVLRVAITMLIGVSVGVLGYLLSRCVTSVIRSNVHRLMSMMRQDPTSAFFYTLFVSVALTLASSLCVTFGSWQARGSGVGRLNAYLSGFYSSQFLALRTCFFKSLGLVLNVSSGMKQGVEGPFIHIGAMLGLHVSRLSLRLLRCLPARLQPRSALAALASVGDERLFISSGAAAGFSVAFNAPIAGVLYVQDGAFAHWSSTFTFHTFICTMMAVATVNMCFSEGDVLPTRGLIDIENQARTSILIQELPGFFLLGLIGGLAGASFTCVNVWIERKRHRFLSKRRLPNLIDVLVCTAGVVVISFVLPLLFPCIEPYDMCLEHPDRCLRFHCSPSTFSPMATFLFTLPEETIRTLYDRNPTPNVHAAVFVVSVFLVAYFFFSSLTYGMAVPGGIFVPSIIIGACYGRLVGWMLARIFPATMHDGVVIPGVNAGVYAVLGSASMLGGTTRSTLPITVMLIEITSDAQFLIPIMVVVVVAKVVADRITDSLYAQHLKMENMMMSFSERVPASLHALCAADMMQPSTVALRVCDSLDACARALQQHGGMHAFPVVAPRSAWASSSHDVVDGEDGGAAGDAGVVDGAYATGGGVRSSDPDAGVASGLRLRRTANGATSGAAAGAVDSVSASAIASPMSGVGGAASSVRHANGGGPISRWRTTRSSEMTLSSRATVASAMASASAVPAVAGDVGSDGSNGAASHFSVQHTGSPRAFPHSSPTLSPYSGSEETAHRAWLEPTDVFVGLIHQRHLDVLVQRAYASIQATSAASAATAAARAAAAAARASTISSNPSSSSSHDNADSAVRAVTPLGAALASHDVDALRSTGDVESIELTPYVHTVDVNGDASSMSTVDVRDENHHVSIAASPRKQPNGFPPSIDVHHVCDPSSLSSTGGEHEFRSLLDSSPRASPALSSSAAIEPSIASSDRARLNGTTHTSSMYGDNRDAPPSSVSLVISSSSSSLSDMNNDVGDAHEDHLASDTSGAANGDGAEPSVSSLSSSSVSSLPSSESASASASSTSASSSFYLPFALTIQLAAARLFRLSIPWQRLPTTGGKQRRDRGNDGDDEEEEDDADDDGGAATPSNRRVASRETVDARAGAGAADSCVSPATTDANETAARRGSRTRSPHASLSDEHALLTRDHGAPSDDVEEEEEEDAAAHGGRQQRARPSSRQRARPSQQRSRQPRGARSLDHSVDLDASDQWSAATASSHAQSSAAAATASSPPSHSSISAVTAAGFLIDLSPFVDAGPYIVGELTPARRVWALFRSLGMRAVVVVDVLHRPVGVITRQSLVRYSLMDREWAAIATIATAPAATAATAPTGSPTAASQPRSGM